MALRLLPSQRTNCQRRLAAKEADEYQRREIIDTIATPTTLEANERELIRQSLERNNCSRKNTAKELNISERTLYRKIREFELE